MNIRPEPKIRESLLDFRIHDQVWLRRLHRAQLSLLHIYYPYETSISRLRACQPAVRALLQVPSSSSPTPHALGTVDMSDPFGQAEAAAR